VLRGIAIQQEHGADAAGTVSLGAISQFLMDIACGDHRSFAFGAWSVLDAFEDSQLSSLGVPRLRSRVFLLLRFRIFPEIV
jgi:hypothetical protein